MLERYQLQESKAVSNRKAISILIVVIAGISVFAAAVRSYYAFRYHLKVQDEIKAEQAGDLPEPYYTISKGVPTHTSIPVLVSDPASTNRFCGKLVQVVGRVMDAQWSEGDITNFLLAGEHEKSVRVMVSQRKNFPVPAKGSTVSIKGIFFCKDNGGGLRETEAPAPVIAQ
jgi:hypothetical protein